MYVPTEERGGLILLFLALVLLITQQRACFGLQIMVLPTALVLLVTSHVFIAITVAVAGRHDSAWTGDCP